MIYAASGVRICFCSRAARVARAMDWMIVRWLMVCKLIYVWHWLLKTLGIVKVGRTVVSNIYFSDDYPLAGCRVVVDVSSSGVFHMQVFPPGRLEPIEQYVSPTAAVALFRFGQLLRVNPRADRG